MAYCVKCGAYIPDGQKGCLACGYDPDAEEPRRLVLPEGLQTVGPGAFWDNEGLVLESLPQSLRVIGSRAFWGITVSEDLRLPAGCVAMPDAFRLLYHYANSFAT